MNECEQMIFIPKITFWLQKYIWIRKCLEKLSFGLIRSKLVMLNLINPTKFVLTLIGRIKCPQEFLLRSGILTNQKARKVNCFVYFHTCWRKVPWFFLLAYPIQCKSVISRRDAFTRDFAESIAKNSNMFLRNFGSRTVGNLSVIVT